MVPDVEVEEVGALTDQQLLDSISPDPLPEVYITVDDYLARVDCGRSTALKRLRAMAADGVLCERKALVRGRERWIFY